MKSILELDASINFYMFHGGTNFGFMNGANIFTVEGQTYTADITSYGKTDIKMDEMSLTSLFSCEWKAKSQDKIYV